MYILNKIKDYKYGFFEPYDLGNFNFHGGAEWPSYNIKNAFYINSSNIAKTEVMKIKTTPLL